MSLWVRGFASQLLVLQIQRQMSNPALGLKNRVEFRLLTTGLTTSHLAFDENIRYNHHMVKHTLHDLVGKDVYTYSHQFGNSLRRVNITPDKLVSVSKGGNSVELEKKGRVDLRQSSLRIVDMEDPEIHEDYKRQEQDRIARAQKAEEDQKTAAQLRSELIAFLQRGEGDIKSLQQAWAIFEIWGIGDHNG